MKYFIMNKKEVKANIFVNPILVRTKSLSKIKKAKTLKKKLDTLLKQIEKELFESNSGLNKEIIQNVIFGDMAEEITSKDYNSLKVMCLLDEQEQRIKTCNKSEVLKGKLYGTEIR